MDGALNLAGWALDQGDIQALVEAGEEYDRWARIAVRAVHDNLLGVASILGQLVLQAGARQRGYFSKTFEWTAREGYLSDVHMARHLRGDFFVAQRWDIGGTTRLAVLDIDHHDPSCDGCLDGPSFLCPQVASTYKDISTALEVPLLPIRSSASGGLHAFVFLDAEYPAKEVYGRISRALAAYGMAPATGYIEVFPGDGLQLRLPLGRGGCIFDPRRLVPLTAQVNGKGHVIRDVTGSVRLLAKMAREMAVPLSAIPAGGVVQATGGLRPRFVREAADGVPLLCGSEVTSPRGRAVSGFQSLVDEVSPGAPRGGRWRASGIMLWDLFIRRGLSHDEALREYERWLCGGRHESKDLAGPQREKVISRMMRDAKKSLEKLGQRVNDGKLVQGPDATCDTGTGERLTLAHLHIRAGHHLGVDWRKAAMQQVTPEDHSLLAQVGDDWLRGKAAVLLGLLRLGVAEFGAFATLAVARGTLKQVLGGRPRPGLAATATASGYVLVRKELERLGVLRKVAEPIKGRRSTVYAVTLPK